LKLDYHELLSTVAFSFNLRHYNKALAKVWSGGAAVDATGGAEGGAAGSAERGAAGNAAGVAAVRDSKGRTALMLAARFGGTAMCRHLLGAAPAAGAHTRPLFSST
jgi:hypothetical protein